MIIVGNQPFSPSEIQSEYPADSVQWLALEKMSQSADVFRYDSLPQLLFELQLRAQTVDAAKALHRSGMSFAVFHKSRCNPEYWERTDNGGFRLKQGAKPSSAINDIYEHGSRYATECATAMQIVLYKALLGVFSADEFDAMFPDIYLMNWHSLHPLLREFATPKKTDVLLPGDRGYFSNPDVNPETPEWQGENVIVLPGDLYYGHGIGIEPANAILSALNARRKRDAQQKARLVDAAARPNYKKLAALHQSDAI